MLLHEEAVAVGKRVPCVEVDHLVSENSRPGHEGRQQAVSDECYEDECADGKRRANAGSGPRLGHALSTTCKSAGPSLCGGSLYKDSGAGAAHGQERLAERRRLQRLRTARDRDDEAVPGAEENALARLALEPLHSDEPGEQSGGVHVCELLEL